MRILVTGANGFVGHYLIPHLLSPPVESDVAAETVIAAVPPEHVADFAQEITRSSGVFAAWKDQIQVEGLDVCDARGTADLLERTQPQEIYHLAARASGADADRDAVFAVNVEGTRHLLAAASRLSPTPRVLLISTGYVYGDTDPERPAREEDLLSPPGRYGPYTDSKIAMEAVTQEFGEIALVARAFSHTGPGQTPTFAIPAFARQLARIERGLEPPELRVGNLEARRDLLDVRDVARAYRLLMDQGVPGAIYNVATGHPLTMRSILDQLRALCAVPTTVTVDPARLRPADIACSTGDSTRLRTLTGWQPHYALEDTLRDTLHYWRTHEVS